MKAEGFKSLYDIKDLAVMGLAEVIPSIPLVLRRIRETMEDIHAQKPDIIMTIDSFSFSARIHKKLKKIGYKKPHVHCVAPQVWAWKKGRAKKVKNYIDHLFCLLPYEEKYFQPHGMQTTFIGHPVIEGCYDQGNGKKFKEKYGIKENAKVICLLPGSRKNEIAYLLQPFKEAVEKLNEKIENLVIVIPTVDTVSDRIKNDLQDWKINHIIVKSEQERYDAFCASDVSIAASGTVSLELALAKVPHLIAYKVNKLTGILAKKLLKIKYVNLINILADKEVIPELLQETCTAENIVKTVEKLLKEKKQPVEKSLKKLGLGELSPSEKMAKKLIELAKKGVK